MPLSLLLVVLGLIIAVLFNFWIGLLFILVGLVLLPPVRSRYW